MSEGSEILLSSGQLNLIAQRSGISAKVSLLDVGCGDGSWVLKLRERGHAVQGIEERQRSNARESEAICLGSPAASLPGAVQSFDRVLFRGTSLIKSPDFHPELMIALANMGSVLKPNGRLLIPVIKGNGAEIQHWQSMLSAFPGQTRVRHLTSGISAYLTLAFLFGGYHDVTVLEHQVPKKQVSRLEWHKLAREAVLQRSRAPEAA